MNSSGKIDFSKSSLVSLRAELARKKDEVSKAKAQSHSQYIHPIPKVKKETIWTKKNTGVDGREEKDIEERKEEEDAHKKSRETLEYKAKLYDKLSKDTSLRDEDDSNKYLVDFQQKDFENAQSEPAKIFTPIPIADLVPEDKSNESDDYDIPSDPEEDWVDYVDCLGRTRRCLRRDLPSMKKNDSKLSDNLGYIDTSDKPVPSAAPLFEVLSKGDPELMSTDMRRELMREKWEAQEKELQNRTDIHYQDVLFDEARSHGVGYYGFSADEDRRTAQQEALTKLRNETQQQQESTRTMRERRQQQLATRLKAAKLRKRIRMGLPAEEEEPETESETTSAPLAEEENKATEVVVSSDAAGRPKRDQPVRPWDIGKEGVKETPVMSQEDWVKKRRSERDSEFAPPAAYQEDYQLSQTSRKKHRGKERAPRIIRPIEDELEEPTELLSRPVESRNEQPRGKGPEIAPPPTFDYYGPSSSARSGGKPASQTHAELENSIMAGLKFLRQQSERKENQKEKGLLDIV